MARRQAKKAALAPVPVTQQMTARRARTVLYACYLDGVGTRGHADFLAIREALRTPEVFAKPGEEAGDTWGYYDCDDDEAVVVAANVPPRPRSVRALPPEEPQGYDEPRAEPAELAVHRCPCGREHVTDHVHVSLAPTLEWLSDDHDLLVPLLRADDALSSSLCLSRWARAVAVHWGVDAYAYQHTVEATWKAWYR